MFPAALVALMVGGPLGACLFLAYGAIAAMKIAKVDSQYAKQGIPPASAQLVQRWLDRSNTKTGKKEKVKPYGSVAYARQRWLAMWETLGDKHRAEYALEKKARDEAIAAGQPLPAMRSAKDRAVNGWKWVIDQVTEPDGKPPATEPESAPAQRIPAHSTNGNAPAAGIPTLPIPVDPGPVATPPGGYVPAGSRCPSCGEVGGSKSRRGRYVFVHDSNGAVECPTASGEAVPDFLLDERARRDRARRNGVPVTVCGRCGRNRVLVTPTRCKDCADMCPQCGGPADQGTVNANARGGVCETCAVRNAARDFRREGGHGGSVEPDIGMDCHLCGEQFEGRFTSYDEADNWYYANHRCPTNNGELLPRPTDQKFWFACGKCGHRSEQIYPSREAAHAASYNDHQCPTSKGEPMHPSPTRQSGEVTGIPSAVHYMTQVAATHSQHGGNEQVITAMHEMRIGDGDISKVQAAQEASRNAAELWTTAATTIDQHNAGVREAYSASSDAADKHAQMAE